MSDFTIGYVKPRTDEEYQAAIDEMLAELERSAARSRERRARINILKTETRAIEAEAAQIRARTQARLDTLAKWVMPNVG